MNEFREIRTLVIDPTGHSKTLLRRILANLGVLGVEAVSGTDDALLALRQDLYTVVFCDELAGPLDPFAFLKALRRDLETRDVTVPVVLISAGAEFSKVAAARDAGMNDVIVKPVSIDTIERKLTSLVLEPKAFVTARGFVGPDRRRSGDRRQFGERLVVDERRGKATDGSIFAISPRIGRSDEPATN
jgi:two-component system chemotaxis response regulator CheY